MNGTGALVCCFFRKGAKENGGGGVRLCVCFVRLCGCVCVCVCGGGGGVGGEECITSNDSLTYFSARTCIRKNRTTTSRRQKCALL